MRTAIAILTVGVATAALAFTASGAHASTTKTCWHRSNSVASFKVTAYGHTTCRFAMAAYRKWNDLPGTKSPNHLRVRSPVTGKVYTLTLAYEDKGKGYGNWLYENRPRDIHVAWSIKTK